MNTKVLSDIRMLLYQIRNMLVVLFNALIKSDEPEKVTNAVIFAGIKKRPKRSKSKKKSDSTKGDTSASKKM